MVDSQTLDNELLLQKMAKQLKCLPDDELADQKSRHRRYSYVVNEITNGHRNARLADRLLSLDSQAHKIELARRKLYDGIASACIGTFMFVSLFYAIGVSTLI